MLLKETHSGREYVASLADGVVSVTGPGIVVAAQYADNGESTLSDAIRYTLDRIVNPGWTDCSRKLRAAGYNHTAGDHFARIGKRRMERARILVGATGHSIEYL